LEANLPINLTSDENNHQKSLVVDNKSAAR